MANGVSNNEYRTLFEDVSTTYSLLAADASDPTLIAAKTNWTTYVQAIIVNVTTDNAATLRFEDTAGTPVVIHATPASPGLGPIDTSVDFGPVGIPLTVSTGLTMVTSAAGLAAQIVVQAYRRLTAVAAA